MVTDEQRRVQMAMNYDPSTYTPYRGRIRKGSDREQQIRRNISLSDEYVEKARQIGGGNLSEGIRRALDAWTGNER